MSILTPTISKMTSFDQVETFLRAIRQDLFRMDTGEGEPFSQVVASTGVQSKATSVTATTGGATTGLIPSNASHITVVSDNADKQITLPAAIVGMKITIVTPATGCELICLTAGNKINDVICGGTNEAALVADSHYEVTCISSTEWILVGYDKLGAHVAPIVPDAL